MTRRTRDLILEKGTDGIRLADEAVFDSEVTANL